VLAQPIWVRRQSVPMATTRITRMLVRRMDTMGRTILSAALLSVPGRGSMVSMGLASTGATGIGIADSEATATSTVIVDSTAVIVDFTAVIVDSTAVIVDFTAVIVDFTAVIVDSTAVIVDSTAVAVVNHDWFA
jgi:hypothetical protein